MAVCIIHGFVRKFFSFFFKTLLYLACYCCPLVPLLPILLLTDLLQLSVASTGCNCSLQKRCCNGLRRNFAVQARSTAHNTPPARSSAHACATVWRMARNTKRTAQSALANCTEILLLVLQCPVSCVVLASH